MERGTSDRGKHEESHPCTNSKSEKRETKAFLHSESPHFNISHHFRPSLYQQFPRFFIAEASLVRPIYLSSGGKGGADFEGSVGFRVNEPDATAGEENAIARTTLRSGV